MSNLNLNDMVGLHKANMENLMNCTSQVFLGAEKLVDLNMQVAKASLQEAMENAKKAAGAKDAPSLVAAQAKLYQPLEVAQKTLAYCRQIFEVTNGINSGLRNVLEQAGENSVASTTHALQTALDTFAKDSQALANSAASMMSTAVSSAAESVSQLTKQTAELTASGLQQAATPNKA